MTRFKITAENRRIGADTATVNARLLEYYSAAEAEAFMFSAQELLDGAVPMDLIRAGETDRIHRMLDRLDGGVYL